MNRLLAILLIPFFVVGNSLTHSHADAAHQSHSHSRPHIHVGNGPAHGHRAHGHSHHSHPHSDHGSCHDHDGNGSNTPTINHFEHDSDAIYLAAVDCLFTTSERGTFECDSAHLDLSSTPDVVDCDRPYVFVHPHLRPPDPAKLPLYLLHAALRL